MAVITGTAAAETLPGMAGKDTIDGAGGQDVVLLFDNLGVAAVNRAARVSVVDTGASVDIAVDADGLAGNGFEVTLATLKTVDAITVGQDVIVGS